MFTAQQYRSKAAEYQERMRQTQSSEEIGEFRELVRNFTRLADNEDWLSANYDKILHSAEAPAPSNPAASDEERILRFLGAAVIMHWNTIPTKLRRELFDSATSMGELPDTGELRAQIARFLHEHKNDATANDATAAGPAGS